MKNKFYFFGTQSRMFCAIALLAAIAFSVAACDSGFGGENDGGGTFVLTGIPAQYNGKYVMLEGGNDTISLGGAQNIINLEPMIATAAGPISNGRVNIPMWFLNFNNMTFSKYSGNHTVGVEVSILVPSTVTSLDEGRVAEVEFYAVTFSNGHATRAWSQGIIIDD
jgi:hypothetical protein